MSDVNAMVERARDAIISTHSIRQGRAEPWPQDMLDRNERAARLALLAALDPDMADELAQQVAWDSLENKSDWPTPAHLWVELSYREREDRVSTMRVTLEVLRAAVSQGESAVSARPANAAPSDPIG